MRVQTLSRRLGAAALVLTVGVGVSACGGDSGSEDSSSSASDESSDSGTDEATTPDATPDRTGQTLGGPQGDTTQKDPGDWVTGDEPMTGAQASYLDTLAREAGEEISADLTKAEASEHIDRLQSGGDHTS